MNNTSTHQEKFYFPLLLHKRSICKPSANYSTEKFIPKIPILICAHICGSLPGKLFAFSRPKDSNGSCDSLDECDCRCYKLSNLSDHQHCEPIQHNNTDLYRVILKNDTRTIDMGETGMKMFKITV